MFLPVLEEPSLLITAGKLVSAHPWRGQHPSEGWVPHVGGWGAQVTASNWNGLCQWPMVVLVTMMVLIIVVLMLTGWQWCLVVLLVLWSPIIKANAWVWWWWWCLVVLLFSREIKKVENAERAEHNVPPCQTKIENERNCFDFLAKNMRYNIKGDNIVKHENWIIITKMYWTLSENIEKCIKVFEDWMKIFKNVYFFDDWMKKLKGERCMMIYFEDSMEILKNV